MKILFGGKILPDEFRADHFPILFDHAAAGLIREDRLGDSGHGKRVNEPGDDRKTDDHHDGGTDLVPHLKYPHARPTAVTNMSMSLMPAKGTAIPPRP